MKIKHIALLSLMSLCLAFPVEAKVTGGNTSKATVSSPVKTSPTNTVNKNTTTTNNSVNNNTNNNNRINTTANNNKQQSLTINSSSVNVTKPVNASYKPQQVNTVKPPNTTLIEKKYIAPNPDNKPVRTEFVTRYDSSGRSFSLPIIIPIGVPVSTYSNQFDTYYPPTVSVGYRTSSMPISTTTVIDNTPTNGWDVFITLGIVGGVILIIIVFAFRG